MSLIGLNSACETQFGVDKMVVVCIGVYIWIISFKRILIPYI